ncbi:TetR/AcrR family transcriptional regulator C-terminal domain-containing protein [Streptomyces sp. NPDC057654]|uniref:TetR/AcrR family transcriptional regulator C-terminal domain-containing protein n=1 Tax=Streptomyces sp. NPDC057654 TaxID=3346196 RepID=UPI0036AF36CF
MATRRHPEPHGDGSDAGSDLDGAESPADTPTLVWERPEPPSRPTPSPLSRDRIVRAAIALADADGLDAVSLRKVAAVLDAGPMRLYRYLSAKEELLDLMVDEVYGEIDAPEPSGGDWRRDLRSHARRTRAAALRHEWFADLLGGRPHLGPNALANFESSLAALRRAPGFEGIDTVLAAVEAVDAYLVGAVRKEVAELRAERSTGLDEQQWQIAAGPYIGRMLATGRYPTLSEAVVEAAPRDADTVFDTGLTYVLDGIAARLPRP